MLNILVLKQHFSSFICFCRSVSVPCDGSIDTNSNLTYNQEQNLDLGLVLNNLTRAKSFKFSLTSNENMNFNVSLRLDVSKII